EQGVGGGLVAGGMFREQAREADGFLADFFADQFFAAGGFIAFVKEEVERGEDGAEAARQLFAGGDFEGDFFVADFLFGAGEAFGDGGVGGQKGAADFG